jgi:DNA-binding CsgD family transcriptional regulator
MALLCPAFLSNAAWRTAVAHFRLSPREADITALLVNGSTVRQIAAQLDVRPDTVRTYVKRLHDKTGARNSLAMIRAIMASAEPVAD